MSTIAAHRICNYCDSSYKLDRGYGYVLLHDRSSAWATMDRLHGAGTKILAYKNGAFVSQYWAATCGTSMTTADPSWFLTEPNGNRIQSLGWPGNWLLDVGNEEYAKVWVERVIADAKSHGFDGIYIDDANDGFSMGPHLRDPTGWWHWPSKYPGSFSNLTGDPVGFSLGYQKAMQSFLSTVGGLIKQAGLLVFPNVKVGDWWTASGIARWKTWSSLCSGAVDEYWSKGGQEASRWYSMVNGAWLNRGKTMEAVQSGDRALLGTFTCPLTDARSQRYARGTFLMFWDGKSKSALMRRMPYGANAEPWSLLWTTDLGKPTGARSDKGGGYWFRPYEKGHVTVNTNPNQQLGNVPPLDALIVKRS